jgi:hypothetical protein
MPGDIRNPENRGFNEVLRPIGVLVHDVNNSNRKGGELASIYKGGAPVEYIDSYNLPQYPPEGVTEVFMDSGATPKFRSLEHQSNWSGVTFERIVHAHDGSWVGLSMQEHTKHASDFEVMQH